jgi:hypothetical protein
VCCLFYKGSFLTLKKFVGSFQLELQLKKVAHSNSSKAERGFLTFFFLQGKYFQAENLPRSFDWSVITSRDNNC